MAKLPPIQLKIAAGGVQEAIRAIGSVAAAVEKLERRTAQLEEQKVKTATDAAKKIQSEQEKELQKAERAQQKLAQQQARIREKSATIAGRIAAREAENERRQKEKLANNSERIRERSATIAGKLAAKQAADELRKQEEKAEAIAASERRLAAQIARIRENSATMAGRYAAKQAAQEARDSEKRARKLEREHARDNGARRRELTGIGKGIVGRVGSDISGVLGKVASLGATALGIGGGFAVADSLRYQMSAETAATRASVASDGEISKQEILKRSRSTAREYGVNQSDVIGGTQAFVAKTGDSKMASELTDFLTKVSVSEGVDIKELAGAAGLMKVQNRSLNTEQIKSMVLSAVQQGKLGAVEVGDMATSLAKATASSSRFAGDQMTNQRKLAGLVQIGMAATGSPEEASTAVSHLSDDILKHKSKFDAIGVRTLDKNGRITDVNEIIAKSIAKTKGSPAKLREMYGDRSGRIVQALTSTYDAAEKTKKGSGEKAIIDYLKSIQDAQLSTNQLDENFKQVADTAEFKVNRAFNELRMNVGEKLLPKLLPLIDQLPRAVDGVGHLIDSFLKLIAWVEANPFTAAFGGIGAMIAKALIAEMAAAAIGKAVEGAIIKQLATSGIEQAAGGSAKSLLALGAQVALVAAAMVALGLIIDNIRGEQEKIDKKRNGIESNANDEVQRDLDQVSSLERQVKVGEKIESEGGGDQVKQAAVEALEKKKAEIERKKKTAQETITSDTERLEKLNKGRSGMGNGDPELNAEITRLRTEKERAQAYLDALSETGKEKEERETLDKDSTRNVYRRPGLPDLSEPTSPASPPPPPDVDKLLPPSSKDGKGKGAGVPNAQAVERTGEALGAKTVDAIETHGEKTFEHLGKVFADSVNRNLNPPDGSSAPPTRLLSTSGKPIVDSTAPH